MKKILLVAVFFVLPSLALAVPVLQVGAPAGSSDSGTYADYIGNLTDPTEEDTAVTSGSTLYVGGVYQQKSVLNLGGKYDTGSDWTSFNGPPDEGGLSFPSIFDGKGAVLMASIPDGSLLDTSSFSLVLYDQSAPSVAINSFYSSENLTFFPNNHAPVKDAVSDFLFFDIGDFAKITDAVPNFDETESDTKNGEIKEFIIDVTGLDWIHFDVMALETHGDIVDLITTIDDTDLENNPGSHDLTWKYDDDGGEDEIPEPSTLVLLGLGLVGLAAYRRKKH